MKYKILKKYQYYNLIHDKVVNIVTRMYDVPIIGYNTMCFSY